MSKGLKQIHHLTAEAFRLITGETISDDMLRRIVHCTQAVGKAQTRMWEISGELKRMGFRA